MSTPFIDRDNPNSIFYPCQTCASKPGEPCTEPTENGYKKVSYFHYARSGHCFDLEVGRKK